LAWASAFIRTQSRFTDGSLCATTLLS
jgi:hypothetical protein